MKKDGRPCWCVLLVIIIFAANIYSITEANVPETEDDDYDEKDLPVTTLATKASTETDDDAYEDFPVTTHLATEASTAEDAEPVRGAANDENSDLPVTAPDYERLLTETILKPTATTPSIQDTIRHLYIHWEEDNQEHLTLIAANLGLGFLFLSVILIFLAQKVYTLTFMQHAVPQP
ncbi:hypothetical protein XELAEV_18022831mg [Xenopus laevis]|uniref:Uncharacterized protein n=1 Tax=Xenopus laevis TaxID=8355 RepID=A0A974HP43_XENLA|nr:hypothetical protein XELAEV_18022831mg [Xenopus laevis]